MRAIHIASIWLALAPVAHQLSAQAGPLRGITYTVDTTNDAGIEAGILDPLALRITYAGGRGRIDVLGRATRAPIRIKWITLAARPASPGDFYIFDSTEAVHVRPASKTFSRYVLANGSYNYQDRRDGWPFFRYDSAHAQPLPAGAQPHEGTRSNVTVFWHVELMRNTRCTGASYGGCFIRPLARGRNDVLMVPAEQVGILRWIGPTEALAARTDLESLLGAPLHLTAVEYWKAQRGDSVVMLSVIRFLTGLRAVDVRPGVFEIPRGYTETPR